MTQWIQAPDGSGEWVQFPDDATDEFIMDQLKQAYPDAGQSADPLAGASEAPMSVPEIPIQPVPGAGGEADPESYWQRSEFAPIEREFKNVNNRKDFTGDWNFAWPGFIANVPERIDAVGSGEVGGPVTDEKIDAMVNLLPYASPTMAGSLAGASIPRGTFPGMIGSVPKARPLPEPPMTAKQMRSQSAKYNAIDNISKIRNKKVMDKELGVETQVPLSYLEMDNIRRGKVQDLINNRSGMFKKEELAEMKKYAQGGPMRKLSKFWGSRKPTMGGSLFWTTMTGGVVGGAAASSSLAQGAIAAGAFRSALGLLDKGSVQAARGLIAS